MPRLATTPKKATQFIGPNGAIIRFDLLPNQYGAQGPYINLQNFPDAPSNITTDINLLEQRASMFMEQGNYSQAVKIYLHMADGDPSLDAGYLGFKIGECYEPLGDQHSAKYWYGRAVEESPAIEQYCSVRKRLKDIGINHLLRQGAVSSSLSSRAL